MRYMFYLAFFGGVVSPLVCFPGRSLAILAGDVFSRSRVRFLIICGTRLRFVVFLTDDKS